MAELARTDFMKKARGAIGDGPETERLIDAVGGVRAAIGDDDVWVTLLEGISETLEKLPQRP
jgi:hypothetical protein